MSTERKRGRLSRYEETTIRELTYNKLTPSQIADRINRTEETVAAFIEKHPPLPPPAIAAVIQEKAAEEMEIRQELLTSEIWKSLKNEFTREELVYFDEGYVKLMSQFKQDVLPSEETQIFQAIKFEILMSRNLKERKRAREEIDRLEGVQEKFLKSFDHDVSRMTEDDKAFSISMETQLSITRNAEQSRTNEYVKLQERHEALMKGLKGVRDQRIKQIESSKVDFLGVLKDLQRRDIQEVKGRQLELMRLAGEKAYRDLGKPVRFEDGNEDSPILSAETVVGGLKSGVLPTVVEFESDAVEGD